MFVFIASFVVVFAASEIVAEFRQDRQRRQR